LAIQQPSILIVSFILISLTNQFWSYIKLTFINLYEFEFIGESSFAILLLIIISFHLIQLINAESFANNGLSFVKLRSVVFIMDCLLHEISKM